MSIEITRRLAMSVMGAAALSPLAIPNCANANAAVESIGAVAATAGILFGTSIAEDTLADAEQSALYRHHARIMTADWALKLNSTRPSRDVFDPTGGERLLAFANAAGIPFRGHTLAWNEERPDWLMKMPAAEKAAFLDRHIDELAGHFTGRLHSWDVVNEPFWPGHGLEGGYRDGPWWHALGKAYIPRAFKRAAAADPVAKLVLNEAHTEQWTPAGAAIRAGLLRLIDELQQAGIKLDAVGLQGHLQPQWAYDDNGFADFLWQIAGRGLDIYITEFDVNDSSFDDDTYLRDAEVAKRNRDFLRAVLEVPAVKAIIAWQLTDRASHYTDEARNAKPEPSRKPRPLPFDENLEPKAAYRGIIQTFREKS